MASEQPLLAFDQRFLDRHAGPIISDVSVAIVELVANAWDAYATSVEIIWPTSDGKQKFSIKDNGRGMSAAQFELRWGTLDYNRVAAEGEYVSPPAELAKLARRRAYGRNGRGRHGGFAFSNPYEVTVEAAGEKVTYRVSRGELRPFDWQLVRREPSSGHGVEIRAVLPTRLRLRAADIREVLGTRFLTDPNFQVSVDGQAITFDDIPKDFLRESYVDIPDVGRAKILMIESQRADRSTRQHGIAWHVNNRLVGNCGWRGSDYERVLDGRSSEAKRFTFIVFADFLADADAILPDWSGFEPSNPAWQKTQIAVQDKIREEIAEFHSERRRDAKDSVREHYASTIIQIAPSGRERWNSFVDQVVDTCPGISTDQIDQVAGILAKLEASSSQYSLLAKLHALRPGELDQLDSILSDWSVATAKLALDEIQNRLKLIQELHNKLRDERADEVRELQPLIERSLWVFGPEFESIEFTSNRGMSEVIRKLLGGSALGSLNRPDFVILPDGSVGLFARPAFDDHHEVIGVDHLVVVELKRPGIPIGMEQKNQAWKYVVELQTHGLIDDSTRVTCFVLGSRLTPREGVRDEGRTKIIPMAYDTFIRRAETRMLDLYDRLSEAPFLRDAGLDVDSFVAEPTARQGNLEITF
ncbi:ATP-binding protein [Elstera cyanobacteriorum]|uniref:ATP-binding protein n=1 Tax=Elstera cyanobacteriorum TaxID=2022747 RepID=UPI00235715F9|nr:ATP-binding protein [Elstera cyanobacteriorum]MCK6443321.1 ATP-binding protein [Elstera cyanobacteriorum]